MKICPQCESGYSDSVATCPTHGGLLSEIRDLRPGMLIRDTYRIIRKLGKGGMGSVYKAQQTLLDEPRALKFLSQDVSEDKAFTTRFLREVRALRQIRNEHVVDCGDPERAEDGTLFFSMEYVDGPNLRDFLKNSPRLLDVETAMEITRGIAEGLGAAHGKGLVHRDIKPENILMAREGLKWVPKIADFGIVATKENAQQTRTGSMLLTMAYAAPEQWIGTRAADLDDRTDIYALGGVLFEMLTGCKAFDAENYHGWAQQHMHTPPPRPSGLRPELAKWRGLDDLAVRMLAKERNDRPQNAGELLAMMAAIVYDPFSVLQAANPADASVPTAFYPTIQPVAQPPVLPAPTSRVPADLLQAPPDRTYREQIAPLASTVPIETVGPTSVAQAAIAPAPALPLQTGPQLHAPASPGSPGYQTHTIAARPSSGLITGNPSSPCIPKNTRITAVRADAASAADAPAKKGAASILMWILLVAALAAGGYFAQRFFAAKATYTTLQGQSDAIVSVAFSPNGRSLISASRDNTIQLWDLTTEKSPITLQDRANLIAFSPDGRGFASADADKNVKLWDVASAQVLATFAGHTGQALCVAFSPDGRVLASGSDDTTLRLWDITGDKALLTLSGHTGPVNSVAYSPEGRTIASGSADSTIDLWDAATGKLLQTLRGHTAAVDSVAFSPDGRTLASGSDDKSIILWDAASGKILRTLTGHTGAVRSLAFARDGRTLASGSADATVKLWDMSGNSTTAATTLQGQSGAIESVAFNESGSMLASASDDKSIRLWNLADVR